MCANLWKHRGTKPVCQRKVKRKIHATAKKSAVDRVRGVRKYDADTDSTQGRAPMAKAKGMRHQGATSQRADSERPETTQSCQRRSTWESLHARSLKHKRGHRSRSRKQIRVQQHRMYERESPARWLVLVLQCRRLSGRFGRRLSGRFGASGAPEVMRVKSRNRCKSCSSSGKHHAHLNASEFCSN